jgi:hypothetical protein
VRGFTNSSDCVIDTTSLPDMITAVSFTPDGKTCIAGTLGGLCMFYDIDGLKYVVPEPSLTLLCTSYANSGP